MNSSNILSKGSVNWHYKVSQWDIRIVKGQTNRIPFQQQKIITSENWIRIWLKFFSFQNWRKWKEYFLSRKCWFIFWLILQFSSCTNKDKLLISLSPRLLHFYMIWNNENFTVQAKVVHVVQRAADRTGDVRHRVYSVHPPRLFAS